jgi:hypothetical protein
MILFRRNKYTALIACQEYYKKKPKIHIYRHKNTSVLSLEIVFEFEST